MFDDNRRFRCDDAHIALRDRDEIGATAPVYFVRGSRRLMLVMPGWATACVSAKDLDGENLTEAAAFLEEVISGYVADRYANP